MFRDLFIVSVMGFFLTKALKKPYIGALLMLWLTYMNPHRLAPWSISYSLPLYAAAFGITFLSFLFMRDKNKYPTYFLNIMMLIFLAWGAVCTLAALEPQWATNELVRFTKIQLGITLLLFLMQGERKIKLMVLVITLSTAFYGIKGGIFTALTGGNFRVWGPPDSFIEGNNELAVALLMTIPLLFFMFMQASNKWIKRALILSILLCFISVVASYSRGAFLALIVTSFFLWTKSKYKLPLAALGMVLCLSAIPFIPSHWYERMDTIKTYEEDASAMGRINSWWLAFNVANDRITGGGFGHWGPTSFALYAPNPLAIHDAHSIYFEVLGEMGYPGLIMFLMMLYGNWSLAKRNIKLSKEHADLEWCATLSRMIQVSQMAYMSGGAFLGLAYWNMPYHLMVIMILVNMHVLNVLKQKAEQEAEHDTTTTPSPSKKASV
ncbi:putative O-glycosylation ligase, exosortase A system-associated [Aestuariibacter sp. AA17]|uniref:O-glycosylation ligase, exosortase A system-associated n=1 Tax=Fluctibacter corallii TaxID=2984329 RepID=A0ABT3ABR4_9ALTE|nr:putative O-glycosylation ligase, exosortase A system-associated [Aestuariibacter sp. AA17]MCV2886040.1 putative O-glycosylation ligase, exosortase A system-associated [Aestuariibacter sp. AA17]